MIEYSDTHKLLDLIELLDWLKARSPESPSTLIAVREARKSAVTYLNAILVNLGHMKAGR